MTFLWPEMLWLVLIVPALVAIVILSVPVVGTPDVGGVPRLAGLALADAAAVLGAHTHVVLESAAAVFFALLVPNNAFQPPATKKTPTAITRTATPAAVCAWRWRRLRRRAARRACCRSSLARASVRSRSLEATCCYLSTTVRPL